MRRTTSFLSWIASIRKVDSNVKTYNIIKERDLRKLSW